MDAALSDAMPNKVLPRAGVREANAPGEESALQLSLNEELGVAGAFSQPLVSYYWNGIKQLTR